MPAVRVPDAKISNANGSPMGARHMSDNSQPHHAHAIARNMIPRRPDFACGTVNACTVGVCTVATLVSAGGEYGFDSFFINALSNYRVDECSAYGNNFALWAFLWKWRSSDDCVFNSPFLGSAALPDNASADLHSVDRT